MLHFIDLFSVTRELYDGAHSTDIPTLDFCSRLSQGKLRTSEATCLLFTMNMIARLSSPAIKTVGEAAQTIQNFSQLVTSASLVRSVYAGLPGLAARALRMLNEEGGRALSNSGPAPSKNAPSSTLEALEHEISLERQFICGGKGRGALLLREACRDLPYTQKVRASLLDGLDELKAELQNVKEGLRPVSADLLRPGDVVLTAGDCPYLCDFLDTFVRKTAPSQESAAGNVEDVSPTHPPPCLVWVKSGEGAAALGEKHAGKCSMVRVPLSGVWGVLGGGLGVRKVILSAVAVTRDGGALVEAGLLPIALEAKARGLPVLLLVGTAALVPVGNMEDYVAISTGGSGLLHTFSHPSSRFMPLGIATTLGSCNGLSTNSIPSVSTMDPLFDVLSPHLISVIATSAGSAAPAGVWRLISDAFHGL